MKHYHMRCGGRFKAKKLGIIASIDGEFWAADIYQCANCATEIVCNFAFSPYPANARFTDVMIVKL